MRLSKNRPSQPSQTDFLAADFFSDFDSDFASCFVSFFALGLMDAACKELPAPTDTQIARLAARAA